MLFQSALVPNQWNDFFQNQTQEASPAVNIRENNQGFIIELAVPGMKKSDFHIDLKDNLLTISSKPTASQSGEGYTRREFCQQEFERAFTLPEICDTEQTAAQYAAGILRVTIPKQNEVLQNQTRSIRIQ